MLNHSFLRTFLKRKFSLSSYQIWIYSPMEHKWELIDSYASDIENNDSSAQELSPLKLAHQTIIMLDYPQGYKVYLLSSEENITQEKENIDIFYHLLYPIYTQYALKSKNLEMEKLIEGVQNITSSLDLDVLLTKILDNVASIIPGADTAAFWLYNPVIDRLVCKAYRGWKMEIEQVKYRVGESVTGKIFLDGKPRIYNSFREANEAMKGTSKKNDELLKKAFHGGNVNATISVPVSFHNEIIGVLGIHRVNLEHEITDWDLKLLKGLTAQIAIAIENARLFTEINRKNQVLIKQNEVHATLTQLSIQNKGIDAIVKELTRMLGMSLIFVDLLKNEYFPGRAFLSFSMEELTQIIGAKNYPIYVDLYDHDEKYFFIYPIITDSTCTGCLIVSAERSITQLEHMIIERGGSVLALELAKRQSLTEFYFKKTSDFYQNLLRKEAPRLLYKQGLDIGIDLNNYLCTTIIELTNFIDHHVLQTSIHRLVSRIKSKLTGLEKIVFGNSNKVMLLLTFKTINAFPRVLNNIKEILKEWEQNEGVALRAGVGGVYKGIESVYKTHNEAARAIAYLSSRHRSGLMEFSDIGINRLFLNQSKEEIERFLEEIFGPLNSNKLRNNDLEKTLITYVQTNQSAVKTAELLHVHINTLYQRLKKIEDLLSVSLEEPENRLKIQLACHLKESFF